MMVKLKRTLFQASRPAFLILTPVCIFFATSQITLIESQQNIKLALVLLGALLAHISVNSFNEFLDYHSGLDATTDKTPFSGGSGALIENPAANKAVLTLAILSLCGTMLIGIYFLYSVGWRLLPVGMTGLLIIVTYTHWMNKHPAICLISPGLAFGPLMMGGTGYVLTASFETSVLIASLIPFFMVNNLLLVNQIPDIEADHQVGRITFPIKFGIALCGNVYLTFTLLAGLTIIWLTFQSDNPFCLLALLPWALSLLTWRQLERFSSVAKLLPAMGQNVASTLLTPLVLGVVMSLD